MTRPPSSPSLFARLVHYRPLAVHGQEENQRTEALAAALDSDRIFAEEFLQACAPGAVIGSSVEIAVETQAFAGGRDRIDLQVRVGEAGVPDALVWVEAKVKSGLSGDDQLWKYYRVLRQRMSGGVLVHLAPSWADPVAPALAPPKLVELTWQHVGEAATRALERQNPPRFLTAQFHQFLTEENLAMTDPITTVDLLVAEELDRSRATWNGLLAQMRKHVDEKLEPDAETKRRPTDKLPFWEVRPFPDPGVSTAWREWQLASIQGVEGGRLTFAAGVTIRDTVELAEEASSHFEARGLSFFHAPTDALMRIFRLRPAADLLALSSLDDQVSVLGEWILQGMRDAAEALRTCPGWAEPPRSEDAL